MRSASTISGGIFDLPRRNKEIAQLEALAGEPALWDDVVRAQKTMQALAKAKEEVLPYVASLSKEIGRASCRERV